MFKRINIKLILKNVERKTKKHKKLKTIKLDKLNDESSLSHIRTHNLYNSILLHTILYELHLNNLY